MSKYNWNIFTGLDMAVNGLNGCRLLKMAVNGLRWLENARNGWIWLKLNGFTIIKVSGFYVNFMFFFSFPNFLLFLFLTKIPKLRNSI